ncbi:MAG: c-type cytochrome biogenesis protein CcmI [Gammaproteobacteria bacterium]|nr:c-type cytochrome biogenesis protein CcmI [Gammaproteobacteria bacterium]
MIIFCFGVLILLAATLAWIVPALWRDDGAPEPSRDDHAVLAYESRLGELEIDLDEGVIDHDQFEIARDELARELLADTAQGKETVRQLPPTPSVAVITIATCAIAIGLYAVVGRPDGLAVAGKSAPSAGSTAVAAPGSQSASGSSAMPSVEEMVGGLAERLADDPSDGQGWLMLGRSYTVLDRLQEAAKAYQQAYQRLPEQPDAIAGYAEVLGRLNGNRLAGRPKELIADALRINPMHPKSLWLAGIAQMQSGDGPGAIEHWQQLKRSGALPPEETATLDQFIAQARAAPSTPVDTPLKSTPKSTPVLATTARAGAAQISPAQATAKAAAQAEGISIKVNVRLAAALVGEIKAGAALFVFARAERGPPMPLAVQRLSADALPATVILDESMAMMPAMTLATFPKVVVGARISASGNARPAPGDLQGFSAALAPGDTAEVTVEISQTVE